MIKEEMINALEEALKNVKKISKKKEFVCLIIQSIENEELPRIDIHINDYS